MMPNLDWNSAFWDAQYDWKTGGEEWSEVWGGSEPQWFGSLYPRLHRFLPTGNLLEIAPGFGRWTKYLIPNTARYIGVDLSQVCVDACRRIFCNVRHATFVKNDGLSLPGIENSSCDLVFSFDSLVHADFDVMQAYIPEILRVLSPNGVAFIHHSNLLAFHGSLGQPHARSLTVSADNVARAVELAGGSVLIQEVINWGSEHTHDCLTLFGRWSANSKPVRVDNPRFMDEALIVRDFQALWSKMIGR
jgi:SAM-dependent methyltransferase